MRKTKAGGLCGGSSREQSMGCIAAQDLYRTGLAVLAKGENWAAVYNPSGATAHWHKEITEREGPRHHRARWSVRLYSE